MNEDELRKEAWQALVKWLVSIRVDYTKATRIVDHTLNLLYATMDLK